MDPLLSLPVVNSTRKREWEWEWEWAAVCVFVCEIICIYKGRGISGPSCVSVTAISVLTSGQQVIKKELSSPKITLYPFFLLLLYTNKPH